MAPSIPFHIRPADPAHDFPRLVELYNAANKSQASVADFDRDFSQGSYLYRLAVAVDPENSVLGFTELICFPGSPAGSFSIQLIVDPAFRRLGVGGRLYDDLLHFGQANSVSRFTALVKEDCPEGFEFASRRGFTQVSFRVEMILYLEHFDERPFLAILPRLEQIGFHLTSMAGLENTLEARRKLFDLNNLTGLDMPGETELSSQTFEEFDVSVCQQPWYQPAGQIVAVDQRTGGFAGMCAVTVDETSQSAYNLHTGVYRDYRGQGLAQALKLLGIRYARAQGARILRTHNRPDNAPMVSINRKLGYTPKPGEYTLVKRF